MHPSRVAGCQCPPVTVHVESKRNGPTAHPHERIRILTYPSVTESAVSRETALANIVRAEYAAIYGYGVVVGQLSGRPANRARRALRSHQSWLDRWRTELTDADAPAPEPAYALPYVVDSAATARSLAATLDERLVGWYADLAAATQGEERSAAVDAARENATRAVTWGAPSQAFPGETNDE
jgi:hypothetical protein